MKRVFSMVLACLLTLSVIACGEGTKQNEKDALQGGTDAAQDTESGTDVQEEDGNQPVWVEPEKEEPALDWSAVETAPEEDFWFATVTIGGHTGAQIVEYLGEGGVVKIPGTYNGQPVVAISKEAFAETEVTDVYIEVEGPIYILEYAFENCTMLNSIVIKGDTESEFRDKVFQGCTSLTSVVVSEEITGFGILPFTGTPWLENKKQQNPLVILNHVVLDGRLCIGDVIIPDGVIRIADSAFNGNENITSLTVSDSVQRIEVGAFARCTQLTRVSLPDGIQTIGGEYGFAGDTDVVITYRGKEYTYEELEELADRVWEENHN